MNKQNKFVTKWATWFIAPDGYAFLGIPIDNNEDECRCRHEEMMKDPIWNGYKVIHMPIAIPVPDEAADKTIYDEDND